MSKVKGFEANADFKGARKAADELAKEFAEISGKKLRRTKHPEIDSAMYGWCDAKEGLPKDDENARYVFVYKVNSYESVYIYPSSKKIVVWHELTKRCNDEGALSPRNGKCCYVDDLSERAYTMKAWQKFFAA